MNKNTLVSVSPDECNRFFIDSVEEIKDKIDKPSITAEEMLQNYNVANTILNGYTLHLMMLHKCN